MSFRISVEDARVLAAVCKRQASWDSRARARVLTTAKAMGVYTAPPMDVLAFVAIPIEPDIDDVPLDVAVSLHSVMKELERIAADGLPFDSENLLQVTVPVTSTMNVAQLPPTEGWQVPITALAGDLLTMVTEATDEFTRRAEGKGEGERQLIADEIWARTAWAGLPMRALHAAQRLGMIGNNSARIAAATNGPWKRLSTPRGQIFARTSGSSARLALHLVN